MRDQTDSNLFTRMTRYFLSDTGTAIQTMINTITAKIIINPMNKDLIFNHNRATMEKPIIIRTEITNDFNHKTNHSKTITITKADSIVTVDVIITTMVTPNINVTTAITLHRTHRSSNPKTTEIIMLIIQYFNVTMSL